MIFNFLKTVHTITLSSLPGMGNEKKIVSEKMRMCGCLYKCASTHIQNFDPYDGYVESLVNMFQMDNEIMHSRFGTLLSYNWMLHTVRGNVTVEFSNQLCFKEVVTRTTFVVNPIAYVLHGVVI